VSAAPTVPEFRLVLINRQSLIKPFELYEDVALFAISKFPIKILFVIVGPEVCDGTVIKKPCDSVAFSLLLTKHLSTTSAVVVHITPSPAGEEPPVHDITKHKSIREM
jgi:hypothetical protein